jgi:hypothetical protein
MAGGNRFVQFNPQSGPGWRNNIAVFPPDWFLENFSVKADPPFDAFLNQKIGAARPKLDIGCAHNRTAVQV